MSRPTVILVHGAWVGPWEFEPFASMLPDRGIDVVVVALPSTGSTSGLADDAAAVVAAVENTEGPVILVGHSYGGVPVTQAGIHPRVTRVVYVCAFALDAGESVQSTFGGELPQDWATADGQVSLGADREARADIIAADLPPGAPRETALLLADMFLPQSVAALTDRVTEVAWREKPSTYIIGTRDALVPTELQEALADRTGGEIIRVPHGHAPFQEDPTAFADLIARVVTASPLVPTSRRARP